MFREIDSEPEFNELKKLKNSVDPLDRIAALGPSQEYQPYLRLVAKEMLHYDFELTGLMRRYPLYPRISAITPIELQQLIRQLITQVWDQ